MVTKNLDGVAKKWILGPYNPFFGFPVGANSAGRFLALFEPKMLFFGPSGRPGVQILTGLAQKKFAFLVISRVGNKKMRCRSKNMDFGPRKTLFWPKKSTLAPLDIFERSSGHCNSFACVTTLISEHLTKSLLDKYLPAKLDKQFLQKAELTLPLEETDPEPDNVMEGS